MVMVVVSLIGLTAAVRLQSAQDPELGGSAAAAILPTAHPPLPDRPSQFWYVPERRSARSERPVVDAVTASTLARGVALFEAGQFSAALTPLAEARLNASALGDYARYYTAWARLKLDHLPAASLGFEALSQKRLEGYLAQAVELRRADVALEQRDHARAASILEALAARPLLTPEAVLLKLARAYELSGNKAQAIETYWRVWVDYALLPEGDAAADELARLDGEHLHTHATVHRELDRAERLFAAKRWAPAREAFREIATVAGDDAAQVQLRIAECDYYLKRYAAARNTAQPFALRGPNEAEARFVVAAAAYGLKEEDRFVRLVTEMVEAFPSDAWTEEALNLLATYHLTGDQDEEADTVFRQMAERFPSGRNAERAFWKAGWFAYRHGRDTEAIRYFEEAAARFPRADTRPAWLYWSARAHERARHAAAAETRYRLVVADYQNSYYGRQAQKRLADRPVTLARASQVMPLAVPQAGGGAAPGGPASMAVPTGELIRLLISADLFEDAEREVRYAQKAWGDASALQATLAWLSHRQGLNLSSWDKFNHLRGGINQMKRAYPQYIAAGGEQLPPEALAVLFPLDYWPLIQRYAGEHELDPFMMAALIQQESTFTPDVKSAANAYGLMQLIPAAGKQYVKKLGLGRFSVRLLTQPETNIKLGMAYFKDLSEKFGGDHFAIASYNAGPNRVQRWRTEKPDLPMDEFIDDIPFPETQNYVKKILGMAEDYRRIYGGGLVEPSALDPGPMLAPEPGTLDADGDDARPGAVAAVKKPIKKAVKKPVARKPAKKAKGKPAR